MKEEMRLVIAFVVSVLIIIIFGKFNAQKVPVKTEQNLVKKEEVEKLPESKQPTKGSLPAGIEKIEKKLKTYETENYIVGINEKGGFIDFIGLKKYTRQNEKYFSIIKNNYSLLLFQQGKENLIEKIWDVETDQHNIIISTNTDKKLYFEKDISIPSNSYTFSSEIKIKNKSNGEVNLDNLIIGLFTFNQNEIEKSRNSKYLSYEILVGTENGVIKKNITRVKGKEIFKNCKFVAYKSGYSLILYRSEKPVNVFISKEENIFTSGLIFKNMSLIGNEEKTFKLDFYAGPFDYFVASKEVKENIFGKGFFVSMGRFLFAALYNIHRVVPNWGWAIIILTILIKIVFFPLTRSSLRSMKQLQKLRPYLQDLQKKYKNDPQKMQKEMFSLYREYKINPLGGCIPMFIQFPIFIGFFIALRNSIFLRGAPFLFWIKDLSMPDTIFKIGTFPVNILPLLMTLTSFWQQKLTPTEPSQKSLTLLMPIMFLFIFYNFSSGLLLYWITMNLAGLLEQYFIHKK